MIHTWPIMNSVTQHSLATCLSNQIASGDIFCSFEFTPPKCKQDLQNLVERASRLQDICNPLFHAVSSPSSCIPDFSGLKLTRALGREDTTLLHLVARTLTTSDVCQILIQARTAGVRSIFALRGDKRIKENETCDFPYAIDLVKFIRDNYGHYFTICVAGYPGKHPEALTYKQDILHLKQKVLAGADLIITQVVLDGKCFEQFVKDCRENEISVPIIPGVLAIQSYPSLVHMASLCQFQVPEEMLQELQQVSSNNQAVINYCLIKAVEMIKLLFTQNITTGIHIFTMNSDQVPMDLCRQLGLFQDPCRTLLWPTEHDRKLMENEMSTFTAVTNNI